MDFENVNTMCSKLDLISAKLCFDTAFSLSWLQSKSRYSSVMLMPPGESEWVIWKSVGWTWVESIGQAWGGLADERMGTLKVNHIMFRVVLYGKIWLSMAGMNMETVMLSCIHYCVTVVTGTLNSSLTLATILCLSE